jgi:lactose/L-arabinose transport system ATP-binding protein
VRADVGEGAQVKIGLRPEHLRISSDGFKATVEMEEDLGGVSYLHARVLGGKEVIVETRGRRASLDGKTISLTADAGEVLVFGDDGVRLR